MSDIIEYYKKNKEASAIQAKDEVRYVIDRALDNAERITPYEHKWRKTNSDGSLEEHVERGIHIDQRKRPERPIDLLRKLLET